MPDSVAPGGKLNSAVASMRPSRRASSALSTTVRRRNDDASAAVSRVRDVSIVAYVCSIRRIWAPASCSAWLVTAPLGTNCRPWNRNVPRGTDSRRCPARNT